MGAKILFVDDDVDITTLFSFRFKKEGYDCTIVSLGQEALDKANSEAFDVIILDRRLPDLSGEQVAKQLKSNEKTKAIPIILISGAEEGNEGEIVDHFLMKPFEWSALKEIIDSVKG